MNHSKISVRYSKTLFLTAKEKKSLDVVKKDMTLLSKMCSQVDEFKWLISTPVVQTSKKLKIIESVVKNEMNELSLAFIRMVTKNKREAFLPHIARDFMDLYRNEMGIKYMTLKTADVIDGRIKNKIVEIVKEMFKSEIELNDVIDNKIIGGFVITVDDQQLDMSIATNLKRLEREFINTTFEYKILG